MKFLILAHKERQKPDKWKCLEREEGVLNKIKVSKGRVSLDTIKRRKGFVLCQESGF